MIQDQVSDLAVCPSCSQRDHPARGRDVRGMPGAALRVAMLREPREDPRRHDHGRLARRVRGASRPRDDTVARYEAGCPRRSPTAIATSSSPSLTGSPQSIGWRAGYGCSARARRSTLTAM